MESLKNGHRKNNMASHADKLTFEYSRITSQIYIGTNQCCQSHFDKRLLKKGIDGDLSLEDGRIDSPFGVKYYMWLPVKDHYAPTQRQFTIGVDFIRSIVDMKGKIYVHCKHGHGRAPTLVAAYFVTQGMGVEEAFAFIKKHRPVVHPNKRQIAAVKRFGKEWYKRNKKEK